MNHDESIWSPQETAAIALDLIRRMGEHMTTSDSHEFRLAHIEAHSRDIGEAQYMLNCIIGGCSYAAAMIAKPYERAPILAKDGTVLVGQDGVAYRDCWRTWSVYGSGARAEMGYGNMVPGDDYEHITHYRKGAQFPHYL
jgi:hypothetical protein